MATDFVVIGKRQQKEGGDIEYVANHYEGAAIGSGRVPGDFTVVPDPGADVVMAAVKVDVSDDNNLEDAKTAANNIVRVLTEVKDNLEDMPPTTPIEWDGESMTAAEALDVLNSTEWVITDRSDFDNGGVGAADWREDRVELDYRYFDGVIDPNHQGDYAHPNYQNDEGLVGILLHEIAHMSEEGALWDFKGQDYWAQEGNSRATYRYSEYYRNNEEFASNFAHAAADALGKDLSGVDLPYYDGTVARHPDIIHMMNSNNAPLIQTDPVIA